MSVLNRSNGTAAALAVVIGLAGVVPAFAKDNTPLYTSASVGGVERRSTVDIERSGDRAQRNAQLVEAMAQIDAYQQQAGKLGQTMGANFSVKHLGMSLQDDHDRLDSSLQAARVEAAVPAAQASVLPVDMSQRLASLYKVPASDFDHAFLASEIETDRQALAAIGDYEPGDLDAAERESLAMLTRQLESRMAQAQSLQRDLG